MTWDKKKDIIEWRPVVGYEGLYEVNNVGVVRSLDREYIDSIGRHTIKKGRVLKQKITVFGYARVALVKDHKVKHVQVHRLVGMAFLDKPEGCDFINHKDEDKLNNDVSNLEWCTQKYNSNYGTRTERIKKALREKKHGWIPIIATLPDGTEEYYESARQAERILGYPHSGISNMLKGRAHTACGRVWRYAEVSA